MRDPLATRLLQAIDAVLPFVSALYLRRTAALIVRVGCWLITAGGAFMLFQFCIPMDHARNCFPEPWHVLMGDCDPPAPLGPRTWIALALTLAGALGFLTLHAYEVVRGRAITAAATLQWLEQQAGGTQSREFREWWRSASTVPGIKDLVAARVLHGCAWVLPGVSSLYVARYRWALVLALVWCVWIAPIVLLFATPPPLLSIQWLAYVAWMGAGFVTYAILWIIEWFRVALETRRYVARWLQAVAARYPHATCVPTLRAIMADAFPRIRSALQPIPLSAAKLALHARLT